MDRLHEGVAAEVEKKTGLEVLTHRRLGALNGLRNVGRTLVRPRISERVE
jgi:hypothetical protein